mmetsp:Transcript_3764/g.23684  ORF Transcript_3764/g.23684 Transcript_3764/m.23684 type:complete len:130 (-) Transcript_3764:1787-2176(-)
MPPPSSSDARDARRTNSSRLMRNTWIQSEAPGAPSHGGADKSKVHAWYSPTSISRGKAALGRVMAASATCVRTPTRATSLSSGWMEHSMDTRDIERSQGTPGWIQLQPPEDACGKRKDVAYKGPSQPAT